MRPNKFQLAAIGLVASLVARAELQGTNASGSTPASLEAGTGANAYPLSGFESVNLFSGRLGVFLPLRQIGGRGNGGYTVGAAIHGSFALESHYGSGSSPQSIFISYDPNPQVTRGIADYEPVSVEIRQSPSWSRIDCEGSGELWRMDASVVRVTVTMADGRAIDLRDAKNNGQVARPTNDTCQSVGANVIQNRGTVYKAYDSSGIVFVSDSAFMELLPSPGISSGWPWNGGGASGHLLFPDGTVYRVDGGKASWIRDRNGNQTTFGRTPSPELRLHTVTDSQGRTTRLCYANQSCVHWPTTQPYDQIFWNGANGRVLDAKVRYGTLTQNLCQDSSANCPGSGPILYSDLFPPVEVGFEYNPGGGTFDPTVMTRVDLPNGQTYQFKYNRYAEVDRITLPTGGVIRYTYTNDTRCSASGVCRGGYDFAGGVFRRVASRNTIDGTITYSQSAFGGNTRVRVTHPGGQFDEHDFVGGATNAMAMSPTAYNDWQEGHEFETRYFSADQTLVRSVKRILDQAWAPVPFYPNSGPAWYVTGVFTPAYNPKVISETTTSFVSENLQTKAKAMQTTFGYDNTHHNLLSETTSDWGSEVTLSQTVTSATPGSIIKRRCMAYQADNSYTNAALLAAPVLSTSYDSASWSPSSKSYLTGLLTSSEARADACNSTTKPKERIENIYDEGTPAAAGATGYLAPAEWRGNLKTSKRLVAANGASNTYLTTKFEYDQVGNVRKVIHPRSTAQAPIETAIAYTAGKCNFTYPDSVTTPLQPGRTFTYNCNIGKPTEITDITGTQTTAVYTISGVGEVFGRREYT